MLLVTCLASLVIRYLDVNLLSFYNTSSATHVKNHVDVLTSGVRTVMKWRERNSGGCDKKNVEWWPPYCWAQALSTHSFSKGTKENRENAAEEQKLNALPVRRACRQYSGFSDRISPKRFPPTSPSLLDFCPTWLWTRVLYSQEQSVSRLNWVPKSIGQMESDQEERIVQYHVQVVIIYAIELIGIHREQNCIYSNWILFFLKLTTF